MTGLGYPYTYGDNNIIRRRNSEKKVNHKIDLVNKTVDFLKGIIHKTYRITQVIYKYGIVEKITTNFVIIVFAVGVTFGSASSVEPIIQP